jgi:lysophospholipase L1-like esterase
MQKIIIIILSVLLVAGALFYFFKKSPTITNYPSGGKTVVAFGDSLVEGVGATAGNDFPSLLSKMIGQPIVNMGVSGNTSADGLARVEEVNAQDPKVVLVLFGGNDFLRKVPIAETFKNIDEIVARLEAGGAVVVLLGVKGGILTDQYADHFEAIAKARGALYVPNVLAGLLGHNDLMSDGIHPNDAGYKKIADKIYPILKRGL